MKDFENKFPKMFVLFEHLEAGQLFDNYAGLHYFFSDDKKNVILGKGNGKYHIIYPFVIYELPYLFSDFKKGAEYIYFAPEPTLDLNYAILEYLGLEVSEYLHCFGIGTQNVEKFGGKLLTLDASCKDIAVNMNAILVHAQIEYSEQQRAIRAAQTIKA